MITLGKQQLEFRFPEVHPDAVLRIELQRTLRIPDDGRDYPLPPGLGAFPVEHVDDHADRVPAAWLDRGGVIVPMHQAEALWLNFSTTYIDKQGSYPFVIKIGTGKINAVTGEAWSDGLNRKPQDYVVAPKQPWLDGYSVGKGVVRQFVAMPLGRGYTAEEQITGDAEFGGIQLQVWPMRRQVFEERFPVTEPIDLPFAIRRTGKPDVRFCTAASMGVAPGGRIKQQIFDDPYKLTDWDAEQSSRCFVHLCNSKQWQAITGSPPPAEPITAQDYHKHGLPWFDFYEEAPAVGGSAKLAALETVADHAETIGDAPLDHNESITAARVVELRRGLEDGQVRETGW